MESQSRREFLANTGKGMLASLFPEGLFGTVAESTKIPEIAIEKLGSFLSETTHLTFFNARMLFDAQSNKDSSPKMTNWGVVPTSVLQELVHGYDCVTQNAKHYHVSALQTLKDSIIEFRNGNSENLKNEGYLRSLKQALIDLEKGYFAKRSFVERLKEMTHNEPAPASEMIQAAQVKHGAIFNYTGFFGGEDKNPAPNIISGKNIYKLLTGSTKLVDDFFQNLESLSLATQQIIETQAALDVTALYKSDFKNNFVDKGTSNEGIEELHKLTKTSKIVGRPDIFKLEFINTTYLDADSLKDIKTQLISTFYNLFGGAVYCTETSKGAIVKVNTTHEKSGEAHKFFEALYVKSLERAMFDNNSLRFEYSEATKIQQLHLHKIPLFSEKIIIERNSPAQLDQNGSMKFCRFSR
jgi:hypothetical protein